MKLSDEPMRPICITLPPWLIDRLDEIARQELSNRSAIIRRQLARAAQEGARAG